MKRFAIAGMVTIVLAATGVLCAEDTLQTPAAAKEHEWLKQFVGEWESASEVQMGLTGETAKCKGHDKVRMLGEFWILFDVQGDRPGGNGKMNAVMTLGYDTAKRRYVGTWVDSVLPHMWVYEGTVDETGKILTLITDGPKMTGGSGMTRYKDVIEFKSPDHRVLTSSSLGPAPDYQWVTYMTSDYHRQK